jgi:ATP-dependent DNA ligase
MLASSKATEGREWAYEIKLDGFRLEALRAAGRITLYSRRGNVLNRKFPYIAAALEKMPDATVLDGELVALDREGRSSFALLQNFRSAEKQIHFYGFDILVHRGRKLTDLPLIERRVILNKALPLNNHIGVSIVEHRVSHILKFVKQHGLEGLVAKRSDSLYEAGQRSGAWTKHRIDMGQEFVVGGYTPGTVGFDALIVGFYRGKDLIFAARVRAGFVPATRRQVFEQIRHLKGDQMPVQKLTGAWGRTVGSRADRRKDEDMRMAEAPGGRSHRLPGMDRSRSSATRNVCRNAR